MRIHVSACTCECVCVCGGRTISCPYPMKVKACSPCVCMMGGGGLLGFRGRG